MNALRPFFLLVGRASVFWLSVIGVAALSITVAGLTQPDAFPALRFDAVILSAFVFPLAAGFLAGALVQELQHTTFAIALPDVRSRVSSGFLVCGAVVAIVVVGAIAMTGVPPGGLPALYAFALGAFGFGGTLNDPLSRWVSAVNVVVVLSVVVSSVELARIVERHPWPTTVASLAVGAIGVARLFARSTFRRKPFRASKPLPGRFSLEKSDAVERSKMIARGPRRSRWRGGMLGDDPWRWVRAALYEVRPVRGLRGMATRIGRAWGIGVIVFLSAWADKGDMGLGEALARSLHDALLRSPHVPPFGQRGGPYLMVVLVIATAGVLVPLLAPIALRDESVYPLSRRQRAGVSFRAGLVDVGFFLGVVGPILFALGSLAGRAVGIGSRFDFMPWFLRALLVTVILMPVVHRGRIRLRAATRRKDEHTQVWVVFGIIAFVTVVTVATLLSGVLFPRPVTELTVLGVALVGSQLLYHRSLRVHYATADLA